ncbi:MAG: AAA family ATPase, partial [Thermoanaerobaculia bacterium]|nr:AAA family ATPase [Thermoanaerobaculia bacterium]
MKDTIDFPRLFLEMFVWEKLNTKEEFEFNSGLNILHGKTQADRTILLRLIRYALGGSFERIDSKILDASIKVTLKISANGEIVTFTRSCQQPNAKLEIEDKDGRRSLSIQEISPYLLEKLGLP